MNIIIPMKKLSALISMLLLVTVSGSAQVMVRVVSAGAEILTEPGVLNVQRITAQQGEIFELESLNNGWAGIYMFSGKVRYVKMDDVELDYEYSPEYIDFSKNIGLCKDVITAQNQATEKAASMYPENETGRLAHKKLLLDKHILMTFRNHNIPAIHHTIFTDCIIDSR